MFQIFLFIELTFIVVHLGYSPQGCNTFSFRIIQVFYSNLYIAHPQSLISWELPFVEPLLMHCNYVFLGTSHIYHLAATLIDERSFNQICPTFDDQLFHQGSFTKILPYYGTQWVPRMPVLKDPYLCIDPFRPLVEKIVSFFILHSISNS